MKYFIADSFERRSRRRYPHNTYVEIDVISSPRKIITRSLAADMKSMPVVANISRAKYSPVGSDSSSTQRTESNTVKKDTIKKIIAKNSLKSSVMIMPLNEVSPFRPQRLTTATAAAVRPSSDT